jgi:hypothetical protein
MAYPYQELQNAMTAVSDRQIGIPDKLQGILNRLYQINATTSDYVSVVGAHDTRVQGAAMNGGEPVPSAPTLNSLIEDIQYQLGRIEEKYDLLNQHLTR